jgi:cobalt-zinc-cadmium resistance protein CzcA
MIRALVDNALNSRFIVLGVTCLLLLAGFIAFKNLPVEAYPDVANTWVQIITQWPGRAAEEVEQQITIPIEIQMNGLPHLLHVRSASLAGLSVVNLIFDDDSDNDWDRQKVLERLSTVTLPPNVTAQIGPDFSPIGSIYWYTVENKNPAYDLMEIKSLQDWVISKYIRSAPDVVDDSSFGGLTREYQVRVDPEKLIAYGLSLEQVAQQLTNSNANAGGSFIEQGSQQVNVRSVGLVRTVKDIENTVLKTQNGTPVRVKDIAVVTQGPKIRLGQIGKAIHRHHSGSGRCAEFRAAGVLVSPPRWSCARLRPAGHAARSSRGSGPLLSSGCIRRRPDTRGQTRPQTTRGRGFESARRAKPPCPQRR